jgi:hypothetical protein
MSTYTPIASQTLASDTASVIFSSIPQNYTDLILVFNGKSTNAGSSTNGMRCRLNGDSSALYSGTNMAGNASNATSGRYSSSTFFEGGEIAQASATSTLNIMHFMNYSNTTTFKSFLIRSNVASSIVQAQIGLYRSTSAITSIELSRDFGTNNLATGSTFNLYGIAQGGGYATGGDIVTTDGTYWYHTFLSSGAFTPTKALTVDYLVIAGGGGGSHAGGGGAGGYRTSAGTSGGNSSAESALSLNAQTYPVLIGSGGAGGTTANAGKGIDTVFASITSEGGGYGTYRSTGLNGGNGGSGGGAGGSGSGTLRAGGTATANQGSNGGSYQFNDAGGGGGGAGAAGAGTTSNDGGAGGAGLASTITGSSVTRAGGGGGGGGSNGGGAGSGGGGAGSTTTGGTGTVNTGGGGGGGWGLTGSAGGSGIVIVRYAV